jgi:hypothetical protein
MRCECDDPDCQATVLIRLEAYRGVSAAGGLLTAPGHPVERGELLPTDGDYWVQRRPRSNGTNG